MPTRKYHTSVEITFFLENGTRRTYAWTTPRSLGRAVGKACAWGKKEMTKDKVRGRSKIQGYRIDVNVEPGEFRDG